MKKISEKYIEQDAIGDMIERIQKSIDSCKQKLSWYKSSSLGMDYTIDFTKEQLKLLLKIKKDLVKRWNELQEEFDNEALPDNNE